MQFFGMSSVRLKLLLTRPTGTKYNRSHGNTLQGFESMTLGLFLYLNQAHSIIDVAFSMSQVPRSSDCFTSICQRDIISRIIHVSRFWSRSFNSYLNLIHHHHHHPPPPHPRAAYMCQWTRSALFQAITWTNAGLLSIGLLRTNFSEIRNSNRNFAISFKTFHLKLSSAKLAAILSRGRWVNDLPLVVMIKTSRDYVHETWHHSVISFKGAIGEEYIGKIMMNIILASGNEWVAGDHITFARWVEV